MIEVHIENKGRNPVLVRTLVDGVVMVDRAGPGASGDGTAVFKHRVKSPRKRIPRMITVIVWVLVVSKQFDNSTWRYEPGFPLLAFPSEEACQKALKDYEHGACFELEASVGDKSANDIK